jgi:hypothetical protein
LKVHKELQERLKEIELKIRMKRGLIKQAANEREDIRSKVEESRGMLESLSLRLDSGSINH